MKKLSKGFTLAEVLITLTIIGVISAIALPSINSSTTAAQIGPQVGKAISTIENANRMWLTQNNARRFSADCMVSEMEYLRCIEPIVNGNILEANNALQLNDNTLYRAVAEGEAFGVLSVQAPEGAVSLIFDTNGNARPNKPGRDMFALYVRRNGDVVAYGSRDHARIRGNDYAMWGNSCSNIEQYGASADMQKLTCTGSIVDNNMKALYLDSGRGANPDDAAVGVYEEMPMRPRR